MCTTERDYLFRVSRVALLILDPACQASCQEGGDTSLLWPTFLKFIAASNSHEADGFPALLVHDIREVGASGCSPALDNSIHSSASPDIQSTIGL